MWIPDALQASMQGRVEEGMKERVGGLRVYSQHSQGRCSTIKQKKTRDAKRNESHRYDHVLLAFTHPSSNRLQVHSSLTSCMSTISLSTDDFALILSALSKPSPADSDETLNRLSLALRLHDTFRTAVQSSNDPEPAVVLSFSNREYMPVDLGYDSQVSS